MTTTSRIAPTRAVSVLQAFAAALIVATGLLAATAPTAAMAATVPWGKQVIDRVYENKDLRELLRELAASQGIIANVDKDVPAAVVHGRFKMTAGQLFQYMVSTHGLAHYYIGNVLSIYSANSIVTDVLPVKSGDAPRVLRSIEELKLSDPRFPIKVNRRSGIMMVSGPRVFVDMVRNVVKTVDVETGPTEVRVFPLKYAAAEDQVFGRGGRQTTVPGTASIMRQVFQRGGGGEARERAPTPTSLALAQEPVTMRVANSDINLQLPPRMPTPAEMASGEPAQLGYAAMSIDRGGSLPQISADGRINAVIVRDYAHRMAAHEELIRRLDVRPMAVEIEVSVIEVSSSDLSALGVDWRFQSGRVDAYSGRTDLPNQGYPLDRQPPGAAQGLAPVLGTAAAMGGVLTTVLTDGGRQLLARVNALASDGKASFRSTPKVLTVNNSEAVIERLRTFFVRVPGAYASQLYDVSVGTSMRVTPMVVEESGETQIRLVVKIEDGQVTAASVDNIPVIARNSIGTQAYVGAGQSLLIAGYMEDSKSESEAGVPGLASLPVVGWLFKQRDANGGRLERMYMITPRVLAETAPPSPIAGAAHAIEP